MTICLYQRDFSHFIIIGSYNVEYSIDTANLDIRSFEVKAIMYNTNTILELNEQFELVLKNSSILILNQFQQRKNPDYLKENFARLVSSLILCFLTLSK